MREKSKFKTVFFLLLFLGFLGAHRFYIGKWFTGFLYLITWGFWGIGCFFDFIKLIFRKLKNKKGEYI